MARPLPDPDRKLKWFYRLVLANCIVGTAAAALLVGPSSWILASLLGCSFWLAFALIAVRSMRQQLKRARTELAYHNSVTATVDPETSLMTAAAFGDVVKREIARAMRYGDRTAIAVFDVRIVGFTPSKAEPHPPSPAQFIKTTFEKSVREADVIGRLDLTHFAVLMTESDEVGAGALISRVRTWLALEPYYRDAAGKGIYVRAWAGAVAWKPEFTDASLYLRAALDEMERTRPNYESMAANFSGATTPHTESRALRRGA